MMHRPSYCLIAFLITIHSIAAKSQGEHAKEVDAYVKSEMQKQKIPGLGPAGRARRDNR